jgi:hypothetical protein
MRALRFHRRHLRRTVWLTTVAWCFALFSGVVNACLLTPAGPARLEAALHEVAHAATQAQPADHAFPAGHGAHDALPGAEHGAGTEGCLKFCDDGSTALSKSTVSAVDPGVAMGAAFAAWNPRLTDGRSASRQWSHGPTATGPALVIRFLRLTL